MLGTQLGFFLVLGRAPAGGDDDNEGLVEILALARTQLLVDLYAAITEPLIPAREWV